MEAAYWKNEATFLYFYLCDVRRRREDGSFGVTAAVVAQSALASVYSAIPLLPFSVILHWYDMVKLY